jgi:hypothetical protein
MASAASASPQHARNRLAIAHLLLWTATTAIMLVHQQSHKPPPAERIGFASFLSQGTEAERAAAMERERQHIWRGWNKQWLVGLAVSPVYGAALAGIVLAVWRLVSLRFGFPTQPGHWLLILIGVLYGTISLRFFLTSLWGGYNPTDFGIVMGMALCAALIACGMWRPLRWSLAVGLVALSFGAMACAILAVMHSTSFEPLPAFAVAAMLSLMFLGSGMLLALLSAVADLYEEARFDALHWVGVFTLIGVLVHFVVILIVH